MKKNLYSLLLAFAIIFSSLVIMPINSFAYDNKISDSILKSNPEIAKNILQRLPSEEHSLNSLKYLNVDGSYSEFLFDYDIKYYDIFGNVKDKSICIAKNLGLNYKYKTEANDITAYFPQSITDGVKISHDNNKIKLMFNNANKSSEISANQTYVTYENIFSENTNLMISPTYLGMEASITTNNIADLNYEFQIETDNSSIDCIGDSLICSKDEKNSYVLTFDSIDATGQPVPTVLSYSQNPNNNNYTINLYYDNTTNISSSKNTISLVYPIATNISVSSRSASNRSIVSHQAIATSMGLLSNVGNQSIVTLGYTGTSSKSRLLLKFNGLKEALFDVENDSDPVYCSKNKIIKNVQYVCGYSYTYPSDDNSLEFEVYKTSQDWDYGINYTSQDVMELYTANQSNYISSKTVYNMPTATNIFFTITDAFNEWMYNENGTVNGNNDPLGILIKLENEGNVCRLYTNNYSGYGTAYVYVQYDEMAWYTQLRCVRGEDGLLYPNWRDTDFFDDLTFQTYVTASDNFYDVIQAEGCFLLSVATIFDNLNLITTESHQIGTEYPYGRLSADPYTCIFANNYWPNISNNEIQNTVDPMLTRYSRIASNFGYTYSSYSLSSNETTRNIQICELVKDNPEGIIIKLSGHYVVAARYYDASEKAFSDSEFCIFDTGKGSKNSGGGIDFTTWKTTSSFYNPNASMTVYYFDPISD